MDSVNLSSIDTQLNDDDIASFGYIKIGPIASLSDNLEARDDVLETNITNMNLASYISSLEDVDMAEAVLKYNSEEMAYKAALQSTGNIMTTSLLDYIR